MSKAGKYILNGFKSVGRKATSTYEKERQKIQSNDLKKQAGAQRKTLDALLRFEEPKELCQELQKCYEIWYDIQCLHAPRQQAQTILGLYYQPDKIHDLLTGLKRFTDEIEPGEDPENVQVEGYGNYVQFLKGDMEKLREKYRPMQQSSEERSIRQEDVLLFLQEECADISVIQGIPDAWMICKDILQDLEQGDILPEKARTLVGQVSCTTEMLDGFKSSPADMQKLEQLFQALDDQKKKILDKIREANELYERLNQGLTAQWFAGLTPAALSGKSAEEIQQRYREALRSLDEDLLKD